MMNRIMWKRYYLPPALVSAWLLCAQPAWTQENSALDGTGSDTTLTLPVSPPVVSGARSERGPVIDGEVLQDPAWRSVRPARGFWQTRPQEGQPASEETEVRILYTSDTLYFGVVCYDRSPESIIVTDSRRDSQLTETDSFQIILDTYHDKQNGFVFGTNPAGIEYDGQVSSEGQGSGSFSSRQQRGSGGGFNINWDASWEVKTKINEIGWSAEFAIPFRTLRYPSAPRQTWGLNFQRNIRRHQEVVFWAPLSRQYNLYRLSSAGTLSDLEIPSQRNLKVMPYVLGQVHRTGRSGGDTVWRGDTGIDLKYSLTPSLTLDATYNTDFAQVEVDEQQINLDRFNLFFPEKRPFFLENAGLFSVGSPGEIEMFFSRRIGVGEGGRLTPILGGARLTGKIAQTNVGLLNMQTEEIDENTPASNFTVARVSRELPNRSSLGAIFTNRESTGRFANGDDHNRTFALDGRWGIGKYGQLSGFAARTVTDGTDSDSAFKVSASRDSQAWLLTAEYAQVGDNFNPEVGFLNRKGYRNMEFLVYHRARPASFLGLHEIRPHVSHRTYWNFDGFRETGYTHLDTHWEWRNGYEVHTGMNLTREGVTEPFEIFPGVHVPAGIYDHREAQLVANTNQAAPLSFRMRATIGGFFGGDRMSLIPSVIFRRGETFSTEVSWNYNDVHLPVGDFVANLIRARFSYSFSPRLFVQSLVQYNDQDDIWSMNFRFGWLQTANTGLFVVYNETRDIDDLGLGMPDRSLIIKFNYMFDLLD